MQAALDALVDRPPDTSLCLRQPLLHRQDPMTEMEKLRAVLSDSHFLIPLIVFGIGLALLITFH